MTTSADERLLATCWSSAGDAASDRADLRSPLDLRERIEAASAAGFRGFGFLGGRLGPSGLGNWAGPGSAGHQVGQAHRHRS